MQLLTRAAPLAPWPQVGAPLNLATRYQGSVNGGLHLIALLFLSPAADRFQAPSGTRLIVLLPLPSEQALILAQNEENVNR